MIKYPKPLLLKIREILTRRFLYLFFIPLLLLLVLHTSIESFITKSLVNSIFSYISSNSFNDLLFCTVSLYLLILFITRFKGYKLAWESAIFPITASSIYLYYRTTGYTWIYTPINFNKSFKYADILLWFTFLDTILAVKNLKKASVKNFEPGGFYSDSSIGKSKEDELGFEKYVKSVVGKISKTHSTDAFAIGVNGKWGSGKTSFLDLLKRSFNSTDVIIVDFHPWNSNSPQTIIEDFFNSVQHAIKAYHSNLANLIQAYAKRLINLNDNLWGKIIKLSIDEVVQDDSISSLYKQVNTALSTIEQKLIIFIDDVDRLEEKEIIEVIRLIRNTANFKNTFFIVAYDRNYVLNALKKHNSFNHIHFLEKIFQLEVNLPYFDPSIIPRKLVNKLKEAFKPEYHKLIEAEIIGFKDEETEYLSEWIETLRDVNRLVNGLLLNLSDLMGEVVLSEFIRLEILRLKFPFIYELLYKKTDDYLVANVKNSNGLLVYNLRSNSSEITIDISNNDYKKDDSLLKIFMIQNLKQLALTKYDSKKIIKLLDSLFETKTVGSHFRTNLSIVHPSRFNLYFAYHFLEGKLSEVEFTKARLGSLSDFKTKINNWLQKDLYYYLEKRFIQIGTFDSREDFEKIISAIFYLARQMQDGKQFGFDNIKLSDKLNDYEGQITNNFYLDSTKEPYVQFVKRLFSTAVSPYIFEASLINHLNTSYAFYDKDSFPLKMKERIDIVLDYFKRYVESISVWDDKVWDLYLSCKYTEWEKIGGNRLNNQKRTPEESKRILITLIDKDLNYYLNNMIDFPPFNHDEALVSSYVLDTFDTWDQFETYLLNKNENQFSYLAEFKTFYNLFKESEFKKAVPFKFSKIPAYDKLKGRTITTLE